jgi:hypothetical protein
MNESFNTSIRLGRDGIVLQVTVGDHITNQKPGNTATEGQVFKAEEKNGSLDTNIRRGRYGCVFQVTVGNHTATAGRVFTAEEVNDSSNTNIH